jgi:RNA polymerase sigma factor (sigma-70 family)
MSTRALNNIQLREEALRQEIVSFLPRLRRFARSLAKDPDKADDLVQAACERALGRLSHVREGTRLDSWLYRIIYTRWIDKMRRGKTRSAGPKLNSAPLPSYRDGTTFVYSDGKWEYVMDASPETVTWKDYRNYISSGPRDFTRRRTKWQTKNRRGTRHYGPRNDLIVKSEITVWPLRVGNRADYAETGSWMDKDGAETSYQKPWSLKKAANPCPGRINNQVSPVKLYPLIPSKHRMANTVAATFRN